MNGSEFAALLALATAMTFTPGPNTTLSTALAANGGLRSALRFCLAVPAGWSLLMLLCGLGAGAAVLALPALRWALKAAGVGYMLWMAWRLSQAGALAPVSDPLLKVGFRQGVGLQFLNIKAWMLALTLTAGWVTRPGGEPATPPYERLAIVLVVMVVFAFASNFTYALIGSLLRGWLAQGTRLLAFNRAMAAVLALTALWIATV